MGDVSSFGSSVCGVWEFEFMLDELEPLLDLSSIVADGETRDEAGL